MSNVVRVVVPTERPWARQAVLFIALALLGPAVAQPQVGTVKAEQKVSATQGGFTGNLTQGAIFGRAARIGDLDGDGVTDLAVGSGGDQDGGTGRGAVWILRMKPDGTVKSQDKLSDTQGGFDGELDDGDFFGTTVCSVGDLDGDGVVDLGVGARGDSDGGAPGSLRGAVWIVFLNPDGSAKSELKINDVHGGFGGTLEDHDSFGTEVIPLGDLDGDRVLDIAVGARGGASPVGSGGHDGGAVWILFLRADGSVSSHLEIGSGKGGLPAILDKGDQFGNSMANLGDLDADGVVDIAVGLKRDDEAGPGNNEMGAVYILFLRQDGSVKSHQRITAGVGGFTGSLSRGAFFGTTLSAIGDLDGDAVVDLAVGAKGDSDGGPRCGSTFLLFLNMDGTVKSHQKISATTGGLTGPLDEMDFFGSGMGGLGDLDGDGVPDLAVGARLDDDGVQDAGAFYVLFLNGPEDGGLPRAFAMLRNGAGLNERVFTSRVPPSVGSAWRSEVDTSGIPGATSTWVVGQVARTSGVLLPQGELLLDPSSPRLFCSIATPFDGRARHAIVIPDDMKLLGRELTAQAVIFGHALTFTNAIDLTVGL